MLYARAKENTIFKPPLDTASEIEIVLHLGQVASSVSNIYGHEEFLNSLFDSLNEALILSFIHSFRKSW